LLKKTPPYEIAIVEGIVIKEINEAVE